MSDISRSEIQGTVEQDPFYTAGKVWKVRVKTTNSRNRPTNHDCIAFSDKCDDLNKLGVKMGNIVHATGEHQLNRYNDYTSLQLVIETFKIVENTGVDDSPQEQNWDDDAEDLQW